MIWNMVSVWIIGALCLARGLNCLNLMDFLLAAFAMTAGIVLLVKYRKARKENRTAREAVSLLTIILSWVCCVAFSFRALDTRRLTDFLFAAFFLTDGIVDSVLYRKNRKNQKEKDSNGETHCSIYPEGGRGQD